MQEGQGNLCNLVELIIEEYHVAGMRHPMKLANLGIYAAENFFRHAGMHAAIQPALHNQHGLADGGQRLADLPLQAQKLQHAFKRIDGIALPARVLI